MNESDIGGSHRLAPSPSSARGKSGKQSSGGGGYDYDPDKFKQSGIPWTYILVPIIVVCGVPCCGFWCLFRCLRQKEDFSDYGDDVSVSGSEGNIANEMHSDDIILEMVKQASLQSMNADGGGGGGGDSDAEDKGDKKSSESRVAKMMQRIRTRAAQSRAR